MSSVKSPKPNTANAKVGRRTATENAAAHSVDAASIENTLVRNALDAVTSSVMIADANGDIRYANSSVLNMLRNAEADLRRDLPHFDTNKVVGSNIDIFHKNPAHQRRMLSAISETHRATIKVGGRTFSLVATPIFGNDGRRMATAVEWVDRTAEVQIEHEITEIVAAAARGDFTRRLDIQNSTGFFKTLGESINVLVDTTNKNLTEIGQTLGVIAKGNLSETKSREYTGSFAQLQSNVDQMRTNLKSLMAELNHMSVEHDRGDIDVVIAAEKFENDFAKVATGINAMVNGHIAVKKKAMACVAEFGKGNFEAELEKFPGKKSFINGIVEQVRASLKALVADANMLAVAAVEGRLQTRADATKHQGDYRKIVEGVNNTLDSVIGPLNVAATYVDQIAKGAVPAKITDAYNGDFNVIKNNLNTCIDAVNALVADANMLAVAAVEGRLQTRADATKHQGDYRKIVEGVNNTLDSVIGPVNNIARAIEALGRNDMSVQLEGEYRGDFLAVKTSFDDALTGINNTLFQIVDAVEQVGQSADQLSAASQNMASTSEEQASAVEEVTSSLTQTDSQVKANTENANAANQLVIGTSQAASQGQTKMEAMTEAMTAINAASQNIGKIIKVIDEIAFQTNLLALNAAVEAARAGQHGRGFAVVAQEVRNLAGRSAKAARETSDMIEDSVKRVSEGVSIAKETREALNVIVNNVVKVKDLVSEIATASTEQSRGVSQINQAMGQVGKSAQAGSQQSEELASSSGELANIAARMREEVRRFKLRERKSSGTLANIAGLEGLTSEMVAQLKAMLSAKAETTGQAKAGAPAKTTPDSRKSAKAMLPLDQDERGYGNF